MLSIKNKYQTDKLFFKLNIVTEFAIKRRLKQAQIH